MRVSEVSAIVNSQNKLIRKPPLKNFMLNVAYFTFHSTYLMNSLGDVGLVTCGISRRRSLIISNSSPASRPYSITAPPCTGTKWICDKALDNTAFNDRTAYLHIFGQSLTQTQTQTRTRNNTDTPSLMLTCLMPNSWAKKRLFRDQMRPGLLMMTSSPLRLAVAIKFVPLDGIACENQIMVQTYTYTQYHMYACTNLNLRKGLCTPVCKNGCMHFVVYTKLGEIQS